MTFFYDINKKLADIAHSKQQLNEDKGFPAFAKGREKYGDGMEELSKAARDGASEKTMDKIRDKHDRYKDKVDEASTGDYSAKKAAAGKDIGKPGKQFAKIAKSAGERYGSAERGRKVAGAMLKNLRDKQAKNESKMADQDYDEDGKIETGSEEYLGSRDRAIKKAMDKNKSNKLGEETQQWQSIKQGAKDLGMGVADVAQGLATMATGGKVRSIDQQRADSQRREQMAVDRAAKDAGYEVGTRYHNQLVKTNPAYRDEYMSRVKDVRMPDTMRQIEKELQAKYDPMGGPMEEGAADDFLGGDNPVDDRGNPRLSPAGAAKVQNHPNYDPNRSANAQYPDHFDQRGYQRMSHDQAVEVGKHPEYNPNLPANAQHHLLNKSGNMQAMKEGDYESMIKARDKESRDKEFQADMDFVKSGGGYTTGGTTYDRFGNPLADGGKTRAKDAKNRDYPVYRTPGVGSGSPDRPVPGKMDEEVKTTARGRIHKAGAGGYGRKFDTDEEGKEKDNAKPVAKTPAKVGRPSGKDTHDTEELSKIMGMGQAPNASKAKGTKIKKADVEPEERTKPAPMPLRSAMTKRPTKYRGSNSDLDEGFDDVQDQGEYGQEGDMAKDQLHTLGQAAEELAAILDDDQDLPEWVQSKITKALDYINSSNDYMDQERHDMDDMEKLDELSPDTLSSYADKARGQRNWAAGRAMAAQQGNQSADPQGKFDKLWDKRAAGYNKAVAKGATDIDKTRGLQSRGGPASSWDWSKEKTPAALKEKASSVSQQQAAGVALQAKRAGKTPPGKGAAAAMSKMSEKDLEKFAKTKHKGLPKKVGKKKEEVEETTTTAGAVATAPTSGKAGKGGMQFGKGIYDSWNRELEQVIAESMNISMNMNSDSHGGPGRSLTVTATDEDAGKLAELLKMAGIGSSDSGCGCGASPCSCSSEEMHEEVDENSPDWPTNTETSHNALQYAGGLNKPKTDVAGNGQTTVPVTAVHSQSQDELRRMMEMAGLASIEEDNINIDAMSNDEVNAALKNRPRDPAIDDMTSDEVNAALKNRPFDPTVDNMSDDEVNAAFNASLGRIKEMAGLGEGDVAPKPINPFPIGQDALSPQEKLNPPNANVGVLQGLKRFIMNPTKGGMEEQADPMDTDKSTDPIDNMPSDVRSATIRRGPDKEPEFPGAMPNLGDIHIQFDTDEKEVFERSGKGSKPDYIDLDRDGNKKESMKQAAKDAEHNEIKESLFNMNQLWKPYRG